MDDPEEASSVPNESLSTKDPMSGEMPSQSLVDNEEKDIAPSLTASYISDKGDDLSSATNSVKGRQAMFFIKFYYIASRE
jgi:hypothetical protein